MKNVNVRCATQENEKKNKSTTRHFADMGEIFAATIKALRDDDI